MICYVYEVTRIPNINMFIYWHSITQSEKKHISIFLSCGVLWYLVLLKWNYFSEEPIQEISFIALLPDYVALQPITQKSL